MPDAQTPASRHRRSGSHREYEAVAEEISSAMLEVLESARMISAAVVRLVSTARTAGAGLARGDFEELHPLMEKAVEKHAGLLIGAGFVATPGLLRDAAYWVEWRMASEDGYHALDTIFDVNDISNYDYIHAKWFEVPAQGAEYAIVGPYVDFGGTNAYVITITVPVRLGDQFLGVAGADMSVDRVEAVLRKMTRDFDSAAAVVTAEGRVIATSVPRQSPGSLLHGVEVDSATPPENGLTVIPCRRLPWRLLVLSCRDPLVCDRQCAVCAALAGDARR